MYKGHKRTIVLHTSLQVIISLDGHNARMKYTNEKNTSYDT